MARKTTTIDGAATPAPSSISTITVPAQAQDDAGQAVRVSEPPAAPKASQTAQAFTVKVKDGKTVSVGDTVQCPAHGTNVNDPLELVTGVITTIDGQRITLRPVEFLDRSPKGTLTPRKSTHFTYPEQSIAASHCTRIG